MKWLTLKSGDVRDRVVFAWKATKCADGFTRRFVFLNVREVFEEGRTSLWTGEKTKDSWTTVRYTPIKPDLEAEAEAAAAQAIRDSRPQPKYPVFTVTGMLGSLPFLGGDFLNTGDEGEEWKSNKDEEEER